MEDKGGEKKIIPADSSSVLSEISDFFTDLFTGGTIPAPIIRNAIKAFSQLCTAAIDIPVAYLESVSTEIREETKARVKIIESTGESITSHVNVDEEYARVAVKKYGQRILRERINLDNISIKAAKQLQEKSNSEPQNDESESKEDISEEWINAFEKEASNISSEEMQILFAKILAGEIQNPSTYSIRTVKLLGELDKQAATLFKKLCSSAFSIRAGNFVIDARVPSLSGNAAHNSLQAYGLQFDNLNILQEYGLIISDYNAYYDYRICIANDKHEIPIPITYNNKLFGFLPLQEYKLDQPFKINGVTFSRSGKELLNIVETAENPKFTESLITYFESRGMKFLKIAH